MPLTPVPIPHPHGRPPPDPARPNPADTQGPLAADDLYAIVYVSTAARALSLADLRHLQMRAQARNQQEAVTGVLLYADGAFMQYLEGPAGGLARVYDIIKSHPWHYGVIDLVREPIPAREFSEWSMAFRVVGALGPSSQAEQDALLGQRLAPPGIQHSAERDLLSKFWGRGRSALATSLLDFSRARARRVAGAKSR